MRIAYDHQIFGWQEYGGASRYLYEVASGIAASTEHEVVIISPLYINRYLRQRPTKLKVVGTTVPRLFPRSGRVYRAVNSIIVGALLARFEPDVVHETYYSRVRLAPRKAKVVLTVYDMIHEKFKNSFLRLDSTCVEKAAAVARADHVICISKQTQCDLIELCGVPPQKTSVIHLGFSLTTGCNELEADVSIRKPYVLYVGSRKGYKNFERLLIAFAGSKYLQRNFTLVVFGGGMFTAHERKQINRLGLKGDQVRQLVGDDTALAHLYRNARAFVYPSMYEGFGIPPLEAMSFDCPVACSNTSSIPEVVANAALTFNPEDVDAIRVALENVVSDEALREILITRGRERIRQFSWERCMRETLETYRKVVG